MNDERRFRNLKISFENSSRGSLYGNREQFDKVKYTIENSLVVKNNNKLILDENNLKLIFDEVKQIDCETCDGDDDLEETGSSTDVSTITSYDFDESDINSRLNGESYTDENFELINNSKNNLSLRNEKDNSQNKDRKLVNNVSENFKDFNFRRTSKSSCDNIEQYYAVQNYIEQLYGRDKHIENHFESNTTEIPKSSRPSVTESTFSNTFSQKDSLKFKDLIDFKNNSFSFEKKKQRFVKPENFEMKNPNENVLTNTAEDRLKKLRQQYLDYKVEHMKNKSKDTSIFNSNSEKSFDLSDEITEKINKTEIFKSQINQSNKSFTSNEENFHHALFPNNIIRNSERSDFEYNHYEYPIDDTKMKIQNKLFQEENEENSSTKNKFINLIKTKHVEEDKKNNKLESKLRYKIAKQNMIDNFLYYDETKRANSDTYYTNTANPTKRADYEKTIFYDDGYGSESNRTYTSSLSNSDLNNMSMHSSNRSHAVENTSDTSFFMNNMEIRDIMSQNNELSSQKKYSKSLSNLDNLGGEDKRGNKFHNPEEELQNKKTIHSKLENLLKAKVKSMNDLSKAATLPAKKYQQQQSRFPDPLTMAADKSKTLPSNYMQDHVFNQLYGQSGPPVMNFEDSDDENDLSYDYAPPPPIYPKQNKKKSNGDTKETALRENMLSELKRTVKGRSSEKKTQASTIFPQEHKQPKNEAGHRAERRQQVPTLNQYDAKMAMNALKDFDQIDSYLDQEVNSYNSLYTGKKENNNSKNKNEGIQSKDFYQYTESKQPNTKAMKPEIFNDFSSIATTHNGKTNQSHNNTENEILQTSMPSARFLRESHHRKSMPEKGNNRRQIQSTSTISGQDFHTNTSSDTSSISLYDAFPLPKDFVIDSKTLPRNRKKVAKEIPKPKNENNGNIPPPINISIAKPMPIQARNSFNSQIESNYHANQTKPEIKMNSYIAPDRNIHVNKEVHHKITPNTNIRMSKHTSSSSGSSHSSEVSAAFDLTLTDAELNLIRSQRIAAAKAKVATNQKIDKNDTNSANLVNIQQHNNTHQQPTLRTTTKITEQKKHKPPKPIPTSVKPDVPVNIKEEILKKRSETLRHKQNTGIRKERSKSVYDELSSKLEYRQSTHTSNSSALKLTNDPHDLPKAKISKAKSLINLEEINKSPINHTKEKTEMKSISTENLLQPNERSSRQTYTATQIGKINIPKHFQDNDSAQNLIIRQDLYERFTQEKSFSTPASPSKKARSFSFSATGRPASPGVQRPKSTQSANATRPSTPKFLTKKIRLLFSPRAKSRNRHDVSTDVIMASNDEDIARRMNINKAIGNDYGFDMEEPSNGVVNGFHTDDGDDIDVDFITNQEWLNQEQQQQKDNTIPLNGKIQNHQSKKQQQKSLKQMKTRKQNQSPNMKKQPKIKDAIIPTSRNGSIQLKSKHGIGKVVVPDVFYNTNPNYGKSIENEEKKKNLINNFMSNGTHDGHTSVDMNNNHTEDIYNQLLPYEQQNLYANGSVPNGVVQNGHVKEDIYQRRNSINQEVTVQY